MLIIQNLEEINDEDIFEDGQDMADLENLFLSMPIRPFIPQVEEAASPY